MAWKQFSVFLLFCSLFGLSGCGGGSSSDPQAGLTIAGLVSDGPIVGARVQLLDRQSSALLQRCGASGVGRCETETDSDGRFQLQLSEQQPVAEVLVSSLGGSDSLTGVDFSPFPLRADLATFAGRESAMVVTVMTTLLSRMEEAGPSAGEAMVTLRQWLELPSTSELLIEPSASAELQKRSLLLVKLARELVDSEADPFARIATEVAAAPRLLRYQDEPDPITLGRLGLDSAAYQRVADLYGRLQGSSDDSRLFAEEELFQALSTIVKEKYAPGFDLRDPRFMVNGRQVASLLQQASGTQLIPLNGIAPQRLARYVLFAYRLEAAELSLSPAEFEPLLQGDQTGPFEAAASGIPPLQQNPKVPELALLTSLYAIDVPLADTDILGRDPADHVSYFYQSDASPFYAAEQLVGKVADDQLNDAILLQVASAKADAGLIEEARVIADTQIYQSQWRADAYLKIAKVLLELGRSDEGLPDLQRADQLYRAVVDAKGATQLSSTDSLNLYAVARTYRKFGELGMATDTIDYLASLATETGSPSIYGRLVIANREIGDQLFDQGDLTGAREMYDEMLRQARLVPINDKLRKGVTYQYYKTRVFSLQDSARRFARLGDAGQVATISAEIQDLRAGDGHADLTANETWIYLAWLVDDLYRVGLEEEALTAAASIPASYTNYYGANRSGTYYRQTAYQAVANWEALQHGGESVLPLLLDYFPDPADRVEAMSYFAMNRSLNPYVAAGLIDAGQPLEALVVLDAAVPLLTEIEPGSDKERFRDLIERGYLKLAGLYREAGSPVQADALIPRAETVLSGIVGLSYRNQAAIQIAAAYQQSGQAIKVQTLLDTAFTEVSDASGGLDPLELAELLEDLAAAYIELTAVGLPVGLQEALEFWSQAIFDPALTYADAEHDEVAEDEVQRLLSVAALFDRAGLSVAAERMLVAAETTAEELFVPFARIKQQKAVVSGWAGHGDFAHAIAMAENLEFTADRSEALQAIAVVMTERDDFPDTAVASIDSDGDGLPDFWNPRASASEITASRLTLDTDSDNDGIDDTVDARPLVADQL